MKRPFCILTCSDLHLVREARIPLLDNLKKAILDYTHDHLEWPKEPDFLLIAGDLVVASKPEYALVENALQSLIRGLSIPPFHVILTPGNHEKEFPGYNDDCKDEYLRKELEKYSRFSAFNDNVCNFSIAKEFDASFNSFGQFYQKYCTTDCPDIESILFSPYTYSSSHSNQRVIGPSGLTSGLKVFHECNVCFLSVNTEWTGIPYKLLTKDQIVEVEKMPRINRQVVHSLLSKFASDYSDYSLITVMHRNPAELSWMEKSGAQTDKPDILQYLFHYSDILISGHDHTKHILTPHLLGNRAQSFQLGSASMEERSDNQANWLNAGLMLVDPIRHCVRFVPFQLTSLNYQWAAGKECSYPLVNKHSDPDCCDNSSSLLRTDPFSADVLTIQADDLTHHSICKAFLAHVPGMKDSGFILRCLNLFDPYLVKNLKQIAGSSTKTFFILFYSALQMKADASEPDRLFREACDLLLKEFPRAYFLGDISLCRVIVQTRYIENKYDLSHAEHLEM